MQRVDLERIERGKRRYYAPRDIALFLMALPLARRAQRAREQRLSAVVREMARSKGRVREPRRARVAAIRACGRYGRWFGGLSTCLTRSLVAGALLCGRHEVLLHVGFRSGSDGAHADGHAWLTVDGEELDPTLPGEQTASFTDLVVIPFQGGSGRSESVDASPGC